MVHATNAFSITPGTCHEPIKIQRDVSSDSTHTGTVCIWRFSPPIITSPPPKPLGAPTRLALVLIRRFPPSPRSPFIPLSTSSYNCLPPSSSTPQINNTVENVHPPLLHPLSSPWTHPIPPTSTHTSLSPFLYQLPSSCWISLHRHPPSQSVHLGAPSPRSSARLPTHLTWLSSLSCWGWWSPSLAPQPFHFTNVWRLPAHIQKRGAIRDSTERKSRHVKAAICWCTCTVHLPRWFSWLQLSVLSSHFHHTIGQQGSERNVRYSCLQLLTDDITRQPALAHTRYHVAHRHTGSGNNTDYI